MGATSRVGPSGPTLPLLHGFFFWCSAVWEETPGGNAFTHSSRRDLCGTPLPSSAYCMDFHHTPVDVDKHRVDMVCLFNLL